VEQHSLQLQVQTKLQIPMLQLAAKQQVSNQSKHYTEEECNPCCHLWLTADQRSWQCSPPFPRSDVFPSSAGPSVTSNAQAAPPVAKAKSPEEWVETLVQQMASARDMADARSRAASILQTFQHAVLHTSGPQASTKLLRTHAVHTT